MAYLIFWPAWLVGFQECLLEMTLETDGWEGGQKLLGNYLCDPMGVWETSS